MNFRKLHSTARGRVWARLIMSFNQFGSLCEHPSGIRYYTVNLMSLIIHVVFLGLISLCNPEYFPIKTLVDMVTLPYPDSRVSLMRSLYFNGTK